MSLLDLQEQRLRVSRREKPDRAKCPDASDADDLEGDIAKRVAIDEKAPLWWKRLAIAGKCRARMDGVPCIFRSVKMIDEGWAIFNTKKTAFGAR